MARKPMPWFRCYVEMFADPKIRSLAPQHRWVWISVLGMARQSPVPGVLMITETEPATLRDVADFAGVDLRIARQSVTNLLLKGLLLEDSSALVVTNWESRQFASDSSTARVRAYRDRSDETFHKRSSNGEVTDQRQRQILGKDNREGYRGANPAAVVAEDGHEPTSEVIHSHLATFAARHGKVNPGGWATAVANANPDLAHLHGQQLADRLATRWPLTTTPDGNEPGRTTDGNIFLPGTGVIRSGHHDLSPVALAALAELDPPTTEPT